MRPAPRAPTGRVCVDPSPGGDYWIVAKVAAIASSRSLAKAATKGGGTTLRTWPSLLMPQVCKSRNAANGSSSAISYVRSSSLSWVEFIAFKASWGKIGSFSKCMGTPRHDLKPATTCGAVTCGSSSGKGKSCLLHQRGRISFVLPGSYPIRRPTLQKISGALRSTIAICSAGARRYESSQ